MVNSTSAEKQVEFPLDDSNESQEVRILVQEAKSGNEKAAEILLEKFNKLIHGNYIKSHLNFDFDKVRNVQDKEDAYSILNILFMEAINSYDASKGKFITHLTNRIRFKFREYYLKERLMPVRHNKAPEQILEMIQKTQCILESDIVDSMVEAKKETYISFDYQEERIKMPVKVFIQTFIFDKIDKIVPKKYLSIYKLYLEGIQNGTSSLFLDISKKKKVKIHALHYIIKICNAAVNKTLKLKNVQIFSE